MAADRAIDKLRKAYNVENRSSYAIYKGHELVLKIFWSPLTIADRDNIYNTLRALNKGDEEGNLDFALQVIIQKAQDEAGKLLFSEADRPALRREVPLAVLLDIMGKMQDVGDEVDPDAVKSPVEEG